MKKHTRGTKPAQKVLSLLLAFALAFTAAIVFSPGKAQATDGDPVNPVYIDRIDINLELPKCGQEVKMKDCPRPSGGSAYYQDYTPEAVSTEADEYEVIPFDTGYPTNWPYWTQETTAIELAPVYFEGRITKEAGVYARFGVRPTDTKRYTFFTDQDPYNFRGEVYVNGKKADVVTSYRPDVFVYVKMQPEHEWGDGKVTKEPTATEKGIRTYTCQCGKTRTEEIPALGGGVAVLTMKAKGKKAMTIKGNAVPGATGYEIYLGRCDGGKKHPPKLVKTINGNKSYTWTKKGLKAKKAYQAYVKAFTVRDGKKIYLATSKYAHAVTSPKAGRYTNPSKLTLNKKSVTLSVGKTAALKAKVKKVKAGRKLLSKKHAAKFRYVSDNEAVATVSSTGKITGRKAGSCSVYAMTVNGIYKKVAVTVR